MCVIDFEEHLSLDQRIEFMLRRCSNENGSVNEAAVKVENDRLAAKLRRRWEAETAELEARRHEPLDCVHYDRCLAKVARIKHRRVRAVPCEGCKEYVRAPSKRVEGGLQRGGYDPRSGA